MYVPKINSVEDRDEVIRFIKTYNFATVISDQDGEQIASHIPIELELRGDDIFLKGHLAKANPQWSSFDDNQNILIIFMEAHAYISSSWYDKKDVPTWNYIAVHAYGKPRLFEQEELMNFVIAQMDKYESLSKNPMTVNKLGLDNIKAQLKGIVGFEIKVDTLDAKYKLSQNKSETTFKNVITELEKRSDENSHKIAQSMRDLNKF